MSIQVKISSNEYIRNMETAYQVIKKIEEAYSKNIIFIKNFSENIRIDVFLNMLISNGFIEESFKDFVKEEYGEPWIKGYPIDSEILVEAIHLWTGLDTDTVAEYLSYIISKAAVLNTEIRADIYNLFYPKSNSGIVNIEPIEKQYRDIKFTKNMEEITKLDLKKESYDSILESVEVILALTDEPLIKEQIMSIKENIVTKED